MAWLEFTVETAGKSVETVAEQLTALGFSDLVIEDEGEFEAFLDENRAYWDYIDETLQQQLKGLSRIKLYLEDTDTPARRRLEEFGEKNGLPVTAAPLPDTDWEEGWKENYPPTPVGQKLTVLPYWLADTDTSGRIPIILDPGLTFGTGAHPSTQMVLETMERLVQPGDCCLDLGSGSGILSIAALRLGAAQTVGVDIDAKAEDIARENAAYNGFDGEVFTALTGNVTQDAALMEALERRSWQVVLVNIVADVIISLAPVLPKFLGEDTTLICSGILDVRLPEVKAALTTAGLQIREIHAREDWRCVVAGK